MTAQEIFERSISRKPGTSPLRENWIAVYQDKRVLLKNGKSIWNKVNHAKAASTNAFEQEMWTDRHLYKLPHEERKKLLNDFKVWRESAVQFVRLETWELWQKEKDHEA